MFEDIRHLYVKTLFEEKIIPRFESLSEENKEDIVKLIKSSLLDFESRLSDALNFENGLEAVIYQRLSPFQAFKHLYRDIGEYLQHKHRERLNSKTALGSDFDGDAPVQALQEFHTHLVDGLQLEGTTLLDELVQENCLDDSDVASIKTKPTSRKKNEQLVYILATRVRGEDILKKFIPALKSEHSHLASGFLKVYGHISPKDRRCPHCRLKGKVDPKVIAEMLFIKTLITENELRDFRENPCWTDEKWDKIFSKVPDCSVLTECLEPKFPDFYTELINRSHVNLKKCTCNCGETDLISIPSNDSVSVFGESTDKTIEDTIPAYPMNSHNRGICVIIHNTDYNTNPESHAAKDVAKMKTLFSGYGFSVEHITNLTKRHMEFRLKEIAGRDHSNYDAFVCIIALGGRDRDHVCDVSAESLHIAYLVNPFRASNCPTLAGKPKVFMLPYASGPRRTPGLVIKEPVPFNHLETKKRVVPEDADIVYARGTLPGYTVSSCKRTGSWFLTNLVDVMERHGDTVDFVSCLAMVNDGVGRVEYTKNDIPYTQTSHVTSTLRRALYFKRRPRSRSNSSQEEIATSPEMSRM